MKTQNQLIAEFNEVRKSQKSINQFSSVSDFINHAQDIAVKKATILNEAEILFGTK